MCSNSMNVAENLLNYKKKKTNKKQTSHESEVGCSYYKEEKDKDDPVCIFKAETCHSVVQFEENWLYGKN